MPAPPERASRPENPRTSSREARRRTWIYRLALKLTVAERRALIVRLIVATVLVAVLVLISPSFFGWALAVGATIVAVPISRLRSYAAAFLPYGAAWLVFTMLRALADETTVPLRTRAVTNIERDMFFGTTPTIWLQAHLFDPLSLAWYDYATTFVHWSYFFLPHVLAIILWRRYPDLFSRYLISTTLLLGAGLVVYFLVPAAPPWLTTDTAPQEDIFRVMANVGREINSSLYDRTYSVVGDSNPVAAMPSMHQAITFLACLFVARFGLWWAVAAWIYAAAMGFSLVYTGEHYVIDIVVGSALALYAYVMANRWATSIIPMLRTAWRHFRNPHPATSPPAS